MKCKPHRIASRVAALTALTVGGLAMFGASAAFAGTSAGSARIVTPANVQLDSGGSTTTWSIQLPPQAHCTKDTATNNYHVNGYIVPAAVNPTTLTFTSSGPTDPTANPFDYPLVDQFGTPYIGGNTAPTTGQVIQIPNFNWAAFSIDGRGGTASLPAGVYNVGIGCSTGAATNNEDVFWNVQETFSPSSTDAAGETWTAANPPPFNVPESSVAILLPLSMIAVLGTGVVVVMRRRRHSDQPPMAA